MHKQTKSCPGYLRIVYECLHKQITEAKKQAIYPSPSKEEVVAVHFWVKVIESGLLGTYFPGIGVRVKLLLGVQMDAVVV